MGSGSLRQATRARRVPPAAASHHAGLDILVGDLLVVVGATAGCVHGRGCHGVEGEDELLAVTHAGGLGVIPRDTCKGGNRRALSRVRVGTQGSRQRSSATRLQRMALLPPYAPPRCETPRVPASGGSRRPWVSGPGLCAPAEDPRTPAMTPVPWVPNAWASLAWDTQAPGWGFLRLKGKGLAGCHKPADLKESLASTSTVSPRPVPGGGSPTSQPQSLQRPWCGWRLLQGKGPLENSPLPQAVERLLEPGSLKQPKQGDPHGEAALQPPGRLLPPAGRPLAGQWLTAEP